MRVEILKINCDNPEASLIRYAADQIRAGEVLGMPTDTFYGLAADPFNLRAVDRVYDIKSRSRHKPLSLLIADVDQAEQLAEPLTGRILCIGAALLAWTSHDHRKGLFATSAQSNSQYRQRSAAGAKGHDSVGGSAGGADSDYRDFREPQRRIRMYDSVGGARSIAGPNLQSSSMGALLPAKWPRPSLTLPTKKPAGASCGKAPFLLRRFPSFSRKDESGNKPAPAKPLAFMGGGAGCGGFAAFLGITSILIVHEAGLQEVYPADAIVVFGAAEYAGRPSPVLRARLDHAYDLFEHGAAPVVITTGGSGCRSHVQ